MRAKAGVSIRQATRADIPTIIRVEKQSFGRDAWDRQLFLEHLLKPHRCVFLVALESERLAGYALAVHNHVRAELDSIAVTPSRRGHGIAAALVKNVIAVLRLRGVSKIALVVRLDNQPAISLYRKLGFERERRINSYYEDGAPAWRMRALL